MTTLCQTGPVQNSERKKKNKQTSRPKSYPHAIYILDGKI